VLGESAPTVIDFDEPEYQDLVRPIPILSGQQVLNWGNQLRWALHSSC